MQCSVCTPIIISHGVDPQFYDYARLDTIHHLFSSVPVLLTNR